jgi:hypothetical protein
MSLRKLARDRHRLALLLRDAKRAHHVVEQSLTAHSPWQLWYAGYLVARLPELGSTRGLAERLSAAAERFTGDDWRVRYGYVLLAEHATR